MNPVTEQEVDGWIAEVRASKKYAPISTELIRSILLAEAPHQKNPRELIKAARNKLHQVGAAFQETPIPYAALTAQIDALGTQVQAEETRQFLRTALARHASTRERLPILAEFFAATLAPIAPVASVLDLACGFTPLCLPWMPLAETASYTGIDIYADMVGLLDHFYAHFGLPHTFLVGNVLGELPPQPVELALLLKTLPCLEQVQKGAGARLLEEVPAENILVSFPAHSLGGRAKGMAANYEAYFNQITSGKKWKITRSLFAGELAFLVQK